jgi:hypothetical protein
MAGLAICSGGCCSFQKFVSVMQRLDHRCCPTSSFDTPPIISEPILQGAAGGLVAAEIAGVPPKTAVDAVVELEGKLEKLQDDNQRLRSSLSLAERTIENQRATMNEAAAELEKARLEFGRVQTEMNTWREELSRLDAQCRMDQSQFHALMAGMERRLESMLSQCSGDLDMTAKPALDVNPYPHPESVGDRSGSSGVPGVQLEFSDPAERRTHASSSQSTEARGRTP